MDTFQSSMLQYMSNLTAEIKKIKDDVAEIKNNINDLKSEHEEFIKAFPTGIDDHRKDHQKKKKWLLF